MSEKDYFSTSGHAWLVHVLVMVKVCLYHEVGSLRVTGVAGQKWGGGSTWNLQLFKSRQENISHLFGIFI